MESAWETSCLVRRDGRHCPHWYDNAGPCCGCGDDAGAPTPPSAFELTAAVAFSGLTWAADVSDIEMSAADEYARLSMPDEDAPRRTDA